MSRSTAPERPEPSKTPRSSPRLFYGWVMLPVCTAAAVCSSPGQTYSMSAFNVPLKTALGLSDGQISALYMTATLISSMLVPTIGWVIDRRGQRVTLAAVSIGLALACFAAGAVTGPITLLGAFLVLRLLGQGGMILLAGNTLAMWFRNRLGSASGIKNMGLAGAIALVPAINTYLIDAIGWRGAFMALGAGVGVIMLPLLAIVFRNRPEDVGQAPDGLHAGEATDADDGDGDGEADEGAADYTLGQAMRTRAYWIAASQVMLFGGVATAVQFHAEPIFLESGLSEPHAVAMFTAFGLTFAVLPLPAGMLADRLPLKAMLAGAASLTAMIPAIALMLAAPWMGVLLGMALGAAQGVMATTIGPLLARFYGRSNLGKISGPFHTMGVLGSAVGPVVVGVGKDLTGSATPGLLILLAACLPVAVLALAASAPDEVSPMAERERA